MLRLIFLASSSMFIVMATADDQQIKAKSYAHSFEPITEKVLYVPFDQPRVVYPDFLTNKAEPQAAPAEVVAVSAPAVQPQPEPVAEEIAPVRQPVFVVTATRLNVRSGPSTSHAVTDQLANGDYVSIVGDTGSGWVEVQAEGAGLIGFVSAKYLRPSD